MERRVNKRERRLRRARKTRAKIRELGMVRLTVYKTPRHTYAQIFTPDGSRVLTAASTLEEAIRQQLAEVGTGNIEAAKLVGRIIAERARRLGIERVAFDRSGFKYHGRIKALADAAREAGLQF